MPRNYGASKIKLFFTVSWIIVFILLMVYADSLSRGNEKIYMNPAFVQMDEGSSDSINLDSIATVELDDQENGIIKYTVKPGDNLGKIASMFGTTISNIKKTNSLGSRPIRAGEKLVITDDKEGIIYDLPEKTNILVFANKYNFNVEDFMTLNGLQDETEILQQGQELFLPINQERAYELGLLTRPEPEPEKKYIPITNKPILNKKQTTLIANNKGNKNDEQTEKSPKKSAVISKSLFSRKVSNGFAPGNCTWYVATKMPKIFPYIDEDSQSRPFGGNANQRYSNASKAGFSVGKTPRAGSIIVYSRLRSSAGHVGIVRGYDPDTGILKIEDMNYAGKYIVTVRNDNKNNENIIGYIYP